LFKELQRRNVFRVGMAYLAAAWLLLQVLDLVLAATESPAWVMQYSLLAAAVGFPIALLFAWAYEITPEGVQREREANSTAPLVAKSAGKLDRLIIAFLAAAVIILLVDEFMLDNREAEVSTARQSIAVLPFVPMSDGQDDEYFADGLTEEILNSLAQIPELFVTSRTATFYYKDKNIPIPEMAADLGVDHIVEGSVRRSGDTLRITAQLIRASDGFHLWSHTYDEPDEETFRIQTDIAENISAALDIILDDERRQRMLDKGWRNPHSYIAYQKAWEADGKAHATNISADPAAFENMRQAWTDFIELQPDYGLAYQKRADFYLHRVSQEAFGLDGSEASGQQALDQVIENLESAVRFAGSDGIRFSAMIELALVSGEFDRLPELVEAVATSEECITVGWWYSLIALVSPDLDLQISNTLTSCNPLSSSPYIFAGLAMARKGETGKAVELLQRALEMSGSSYAGLQLVNVLMADGNMDEAERIFDRDIGSSSDSALMAAARGDRDKVVTIYARRLEQGRNIDSNMYAKVGDLDAANREAMVIDRLPAGPYLLLIDVSQCLCGAPFDLSATPEFARLVEEAQIPWPPPSPIEWPLKEWR